VSSSYPIADAASAVTAVTSDPSQVKVHITSAANR
jgi:hypothetical protein